TSFNETHQYLDDGTYTIDLALTDDDTGSDSDTLTVTVENVAPMLSNVVITTPVNENDTATLSGDITDPGTLDTLTLAIDWGDGNSDTFNYPAGTTSFNETHQYLDDGTYTIDLALTDDDTGSDSDTLTVTVENVAPVLSNVTITTPVNENDTATLSGALTDPGVLDTFTLTIDWGDGSLPESSNYPAGATVFGGTHQYLDDNPSGTLVDDYNITVTMEDNAAEQDVSSIVVTVNNVAPSCEGITAPMEPCEAGTVVTVGASFTDVGTLDTHTAHWDWGDETTSEGDVDESNGSGTVIGTHTYTSAGVYTVTLIIIDDDTGQSNESASHYVVVYDPSAGFATGAGWFNSPEGAYASDPSLTGKANFGFVSKYKKGADVPIGQTEFQFKVASFNFHSSNYDWLVIAGDKAMYKGTGTINGEGEFEFILSAIDANVNQNDNHTADRFRIKIWDKATGEVIYDNQMDDADDANATTEIQGGSIVIHKTK
ncbi:MAG: PKD domain-containing protein, partial [Chloroflexota bacterium]|nr:PKD domain-containing protein [Chloroflexota bacterium]